MLPSQPAFVMVRALHGSASRGRKAKMVRLLATVLTCLVTSLAPQWAIAADIGQVKNLEGDVRVIRDSTERALKLGEWVRQANTVRTGVNGRVGITFIDNSRFSAGPNTTLNLERFRFNPTTHEGAFFAKLRKGTIAVTSGQLAKRSGKQMRIFTPSSVLGVRGTRFLVKVGE